MIIMLFSLILKAKIIIGNKMSYSKEIAEDFNKRQSCFPLDVNLRACDQLSLCPSRYPQPPWSETTNISASDNLSLAKEVCS